MELDLNLRVRVHELERYLADKVSGHALLHEHIRDAVSEGCPLFLCNFLCCFPALGTDTFSIAHSAHTPRPHSSKRAGRQRNVRRAHDACMLQAVPGIVETSPGVRSCMIEYDQRVLPLGELLSLLEATERALPSVRAPAAWTLREFH